MKARRLRAVFLACAGLVLLVMAWATQAVVSGEQAAAEAQAVSLHQARVQGALWRIDSMLGLFFQMEQARPPKHYQAFQPAPSGNRWEPSPLLLLEDYLVKLRFQMEAEGHLTSPQVPSKSGLPLARALGIPEPRLQAAQERLEELRILLPEVRLRKALQAHRGLLVSWGEMQALRKRVAADAKITPPFQTNISSFTGIWLGEELLLVRQVWEGEREYLQGCWMDRNRLEEMLFSEVPLELEGARLEPVRPDENRAGVPLSLLPMKLVALPVGRSTLPASLQVTLGVAWLVTLGAMAGGWLLLGAAIKFGERRSAFLSTVTHELRTPLTTFRLYTEMLAEGMVMEEQEWRESLHLLRVEADRLDHLVRNVLSFSRLESPRGAHIEEITVIDLVNRVHPRLAQRAKLANRPLEVNVPRPLGERLLSVDPGLVEQILMNLVDNACKYSLPASAPAIHLEVVPLASGLALQVRDHGPGIPEELTRELWKPFHRVAPGRPGHGPGIGLGLALCLQLAHRLKGELVLVPGEGAVFQLRLAAN